MLGLLCEVEECTWPKIHFHGVISENFKSVLILLSPVCQYLLMPVTLEKFKEL